MANELAKRYVCRACAGEYIVTRAGAGTLTCCGKPMEMKEESAAPQSYRAVEGAVSVEGRRYQCQACGTQVLCIQSSIIPECCGESLTEQRIRIHAASE